MCVCYFASVWLSIFYPPGSDFRFSHPGVHSLFVVVKSKFVAVSVENVLIHVYSKKEVLESTWDKKQMDIQVKYRL